MVVVTTEAKKKQEVALIDANKRLAVAEQKMLAAKDLAAAVMAKGKADADVVRFANQAEAAGWQKSVAAFGGNGDEFARWTLYKKLAPAYPQHDGQYREQPADGRVQDLRFQEGQQHGPASVSRIGKRRVERTKSGHEQALNLNRRFLDRRGVVRRRRCSTRLSIGR